MNIEDFKVEMIALVTNLIPEIDDDYRSDEEATEPSMLLTVGADADGWSYQTGDNSFTGGAYGYATWALVYLDRESDPSSVADDIIAELIDGAPDDEPIFDEVQST